VFVCVADGMGWAGAHAGRNLSPTVPQARLLGMHRFFQVRVATACPPYPKCMCECVPIAPSLCPCPCMCVYVCVGALGQGLLLMPREVQESSLLDQYLMPR
jgi:hypothetical protein